MFWKLVISILLLPSCLGFEIATASEKNSLQTLPTPENLDLSVVQTKANQDEVNYFANSVEGDWQADAEKLKDRKHRHHYRRHRRYYRYRRQYHQRYRNYNRHQPYYPENIYYRRRYHNRYNNYYQRVSDPLYCHYLRHYDYRHSNYHRGC
ncbi:hypothetical protein NIES4103_20450 [Nostoc sp. NIES-4103]|nr:hypothetical protein NIES4103_20450 [Nostoc sp. NIES-4103]